MFHYKYNTFVYHYEEFFRNLDFLMKRDRGRHKRECQNGCFLLEVMFSHHLFSRTPQCNASTLSWEFFISKFVKFPCVNGTWNTFITSRNLQRRSSAISLRVIRKWLPVRQTFFLTVTKQLYKIYVIAIMTWKLEKSAAISTTNSLMVIPHTGHTVCKTGCNSHNNDNIISLFLFSGPLILLQNCNTS